MKYEDLTEEEKLLLNIRRADSWKYASYRLLEIATKEIKTDENKQNNTKR